MQNISLVVDKKQFYLLKLLKQFRISTECPSRDDIRIAGGWVRDNLLGLPSYDIDVALADCTGVDFAEAFSK